MQRILIETTAIALLLASMAGGDSTMLCRGGAKHGTTCTSDTNCPPDVYATPGACTHLGHPRRCKNTQYCNVTTEQPCADNLDCPLWPGNTSDYCSQFVMASLSCTTDWDCNVCAGGAHHGAACTTDSDCPASTCQLHAGECINGIEWQQWGGWTYRQMSGTPHDVAADFAIGNDSIEDAQSSAATAATLYQPVGLAVSAAANMIVVPQSHNNTDRTSVWTTLNPTPGASATYFWGEPDGTHALWNGIPGDLTGELSYFGPASFMFFNGERVSVAFEPDSGAAWHTDLRRAVRFPTPGMTLPQATGVLGYGMYDEAVAAAGSLNQPADVAILLRCTSTGVPCTTDAQCSPNTCRRSIAIADFAENRVSVWVNAITANQQAADVSLGQTSSSGMDCNQGGSVGPTTLCGPKGVAFDSSTGDLWVADTINNRVNKYPANFTTGTAATVFLGQPDGTSNGSGCSATTMLGPHGLAVAANALGQGAVIVADRGNHRVSYFPAGSTTGAAATHVFGQADLMTCTAGISSDGSHCDRVNFPIAVAENASTGDIWVADQFNNRVVRVPQAVWVTGAGTPTPLVGNGRADTWLGQPDCATVHPGINGASFGGINATGARVINQGGGVTFANGSLTALCVADTPNHRVLCWHDEYDARVPGTAASSILGQADAVSFSPNRRGAAGQSTLSSPRLIGAGGGKLYVADTDNNRVLAFTIGAAPTPFTTGQAASAVYGQPDYITTSCGTSAAKLCRPISAKADADGNLWVVEDGSTGNGRAVLFCMTSGSVGSVCTAGNSGDATADLVLGKSTLTTPPASSDCTLPSAATLCRPWDIVPDSAHNRIFVSDGGSSGGGRVLVYQYPLTSGGSAEIAIAGSLIGYAYSNLGRCKGGSLAGTACTDTNDIVLTTAPACTGGYCDYSASWPSPPAAMALDPTWGVLYVARGAGVVEFRPPFSTGQGASRALGETLPHWFGNAGTGYVATQWAMSGGGLWFDPSGDLYAVQSNYNEPVDAVFVTSQVAPLAPAPTPPPRTATNTTTPMATSTSTPSNTATDTPPLTATQAPTSTASPTATFAMTPTNVPTETATLAATGTATGTAPTHTSTATQTPEPTASPTSTPADTPTNTRTQMPSTTAAPANTATDTPLPTATSTATQTQTAMPTATILTTRPPSPTPSETATPTQTPMLVTVLSADLAPTAAAILVADLSEFPGSATITIGDEELTYDGKQPLPQPSTVRAGISSQPGWLLHVQRGVSGTLPAAHHAGEPVTLVRPACAGNCNANALVGSDDAVTVDEILTMVNIALGEDSVIKCEAGDANGDGQITVDEILTAVNNALNGCGRGSSQLSAVGFQPEGAGDFGLRTSNCGLLPSSVRRFDAVQGRA